MTRGLLLLAAFVAGFAITGIEIALGRLLAPFFGSGLAVWASIIASVIAALAVGYPVGGTLADKRPGPSLPLTTLAVGGVVGALLGVGTPYVLRSVMTGVSMAGGGFWVRLAATLLAFGLACGTLATVSPAVIAGTLRTKETAGRDAGIVYGLGSLGSVLGILLPALWWIPEFGLRTTFLILGVLTLLPGLLALLLGVRSGVVVAPALLLAWGIPDGTRPPEQGTLLFDGESPIQHVRVVARDNAQYKRRWLHLAEGWATHSSYLEPHLVTGDVWDWMAVSTVRARPEDGHHDVLIIGLAAGTVGNMVLGPLAEALQAPRVVGVEVDPTVVEVARAHMGLNPDIEVHVGDGRTFLQSESRKFDVIVLDAYAQPTIPAHLASAEFFAEVADHLSPGGFAVLNVFAPAERSKLVDGLVATWTSVFERSETVEGPAQDGFRSRLLLGGPGLEHAWPSRGAVPMYYEGSLALASRSAPTVVYARLPPWTDDWTPVERLTDAAFRGLR
ncbi:MAG: methyltransferase domain-containing protein [Deltaproteobacteria bacterium]|nr:MAG: methyltransferase domain-containing protein [Deltaproteobacteria bacterium]